MTIPKSFLKDGFLPPNQIQKAKYKRLMIGSDGMSNSGKTEFALSAPGPTLVICLDRGYEAMLDNPNPPASRQEGSYAFKVIQAPLSTQALQDTYKEYWKDFYAEYRKALANTDARTVIIDGDSDSWELQRLAEFGKLAGAGKGLAYTGVNAARRAMYARAWDSGKIVIATNKIGKDFQPIYKPDGTMVLDQNGKPEREWDGKSWERQGFPDQSYLWHMQIRHLFNPDKMQWGIRLMRVKANPLLEGEELWGDDCNFETLVSNVYPQVPLTEWGF